MDLSIKDRLILYNQYEILKTLKQDDKYEVKNYEIFQDILLNGYKRNYDDMIEFVSEDVPDSTMNFVWDVLQMYRVFFDSYKALSPEDKEGIDVDDIKFQGFDGNNECVYLSYARFILEKMERYEEISRDFKDKDLNSHYPTLNKYSRMLSTWKSIQNNEYKPLTRDQLVQIISD